ncbi:MAG: CPBP family intramembrane metalloprotease [Candidatus Marinimicrobia bacterium]|jgi:hypothetical protein|nr:CPBP family intramembrane metalloprotease [Candidatus Neomarinimicrobiota bacterium]
MTEYFRLSRSHYYSLIIISPIAVIYSVMGYFINWNTAYKLRNGADVLIRLFFQFFGKYAETFYIISLNLVIISIILYHKREFSDSIKLPVLSIMILEGMFWAFCLFLIFIFASQLLSVPTSFSTFEQFYLSLGAGIYEEIVFRFLLISILLFISHKLFGSGKVFSLMFSIVLSSIFFSIFHYIGVYGDVFSWQSFLYRFSAGCFLAILYLTRGLGVAVYSHVYYDILISSL